MWHAIAAGSLVMPGGNPRYHYPYQQHCADDSLRQGAGNHLVSPGDPGDRHTSIPASSAAASRLHHDSTVPGRTLDDGDLHVPHVMVPAPTAPGFTGSQAVLASLPIPAIPVAPVAAPGFPGSWAFLAAPSATACLVAPVAAPGFPGSWAILAAPVAAPVDDVPAAWVAHSLATPAAPVMSAAPSWMGDFTAILKKMPKKSTKRSRKVLSSLSSSSSSSATSTPSSSKSRQSKKRRRSLTPLRNPILYVSPDCLPFQADEPQERGP
ncbi:nematocyst expressed protein 3-like [Macrobrachium rosenbergii]|uniref:nematocyst expressed protein 3-like n=1 Tax=Macrobrachium rosenbergii TaxID=79674 RepID=UPI0034D448AA